MFGQTCQPVAELRLLRCLAYPLEEKPYYWMLNTQTVVCISSIDLKRKCAEHGLLKFVAKSVINIFLCRSRKSATLQMLKKKANLGRIAPGHHLSWTTQQREDVSNAALAWCLPRMKHRVLCSVPSCLGVSVYLKCSTGQYCSGSD